MNCMTSLRVLALLMPLLVCTGCAQDRPLRGGAPGNVDEFFTELIYRDSLGPFEFPRRDASPGAGYIEWLPEEEAVRAVDDVFRPRMMKPDFEEPDFRRDPEEFVRMKRYIRELTKVPFFMASAVTSRRVPLRTRSRVSRIFIE